MNTDDLAQARPALLRLLAHDRSHELSETERRAVERIVETTTPRDELVRPLWHWIRDGFWRAPASLQRSFLRHAHKHLAELLQSCGATVPTSPTCVRLLLTPLTRDALLMGMGEAIERHDDNQFRAQIAVAVAGLAGFHALSPTIDRRARKLDGTIRHMTSWSTLEYATLAYLGCPSILDLPSDDDVVQEFRLRYVHALGAGADLALYQRALGQQGWKVMSLFAVPQIFERYAALGGDVVAAIEGFRLVDLYACERVPEVIHAAEALARALQRGGDDVVDRGLRALMALDRSAESLRSLVYASFAGAGLQSALPALEARLASILSGADPDCGRSEQWCLIWAIGALRRDGPAWLSTLIQSADTEGAGPFVLAGDLLSISRADASALARHPSDTEDADLLPSLIGRLRQGRVEECLAKLLDDEADDHALAVLLQILCIAYRCGGHDASVLRVAIDLLWPPHDSASAMPGNGSDPAPFLPFLKRSTSGTRFALLRLAHGLPASTAAVLYASVIVRAGLFYSGNGEEAEPFDLSLVELGCLADVAHYVGEGISALVRVHAGQGLTGSAMSATDKSVALAMVLASPDRPDRQLLDLLRGDPVADAFIALRLFGEHDRVKDDIQQLLGRDAAADMLSALSRTETLSRLLRRPPDPADDQRLHAAVLLMASPLASVRAVATGVLFGAEPSEPALLPLRRRQLMDHTHAVRRSVVALLPHISLTPPEVATLVDVLRGSDEDADRAALATYLGEYGTDEHGATLLALVRDQQSAVCEAARHALPRYIDRGAFHTVCLSIADPFELYLRYELSMPRNIVAIVTDRRAEGLRILLAAMEQRCDPVEVAANQGRRLVVEPVRAWPPPYTAELAIGQAEFEALALHLEVVFVDGETGSIVAEVGDAPTGEILSAIFESGETALLHVSWA